MLIIVIAISCRSTKRHNCCKNITDGCFVIFKRVAKGIKETKGLWDFPLVNFKIVVATYQCITLPNITLFTFWFWFLILIICDPYL